MVFLKQTRFLTIEKKNYLGSSGKLTMFFKKPVEWKKEKALETSFRFVFSQYTLDCLNDSGPVPYTHLTLPTKREV